jgi:outer membrane PBP1 activator LpoA protein
MLAAFYADTSATKLPLKFADTEVSGIEKLYGDLSSKGASVGVGPLIKEEVVKLIRLPNHPVPVLALNQVTDSSADSVVQFGLSPEQEVEQAAGAAWFDGRQRAVVMAPASAFGERLASHFARYWRSLGGKVVATKTYPPNAADYSKSAAQLALALGIDAAPVDTVQTSGLTADFVFMIANPHDARLLKPQLDSQRLSGVPIYATSHVFSGRPDAQQDRDLDGIYFCDIPWLLHAYETGPLSSSALAPEIAKTSPDFVKLIALGMDAYRMAKILPSMTQMDPHLFDGATGLLTLQTGNRVQRQLECAEFQGGTPQARGLAPILRPAESSSP